MGKKLIPKYQVGGPIKLPTDTSVKAGSSLAETALLKARNAQSPNMTPIQPISLSNSTAATTTGLGKTPFSAPTPTGLVPPSSAPSTPGSGMPSAGLVSGVAGMGSMAIDAFSKDQGTDAFGIQRPEAKGATMGKSALGGVAAGAQMGAALGPYGMAAGAVIGGVVGLFGGKKQAKKAEEDYDKANSAAYGKFYGNQYANQYQAMLGKNGMKLKTAAIMKGVTPSSTLIPKMKSGGSINVIAAGKLHKENNNLGNGDKGIPVVNKRGKKIFELEKEELILNLSATKRAEEIVNNYNKQNDNESLEQLGRLIHSELLTNTQDNSKKFGLEV